MCCSPLFPYPTLFRSLRALQFGVKPEVFGWTVTTPQTRLDIQAGAADLIEELARGPGLDESRVCGRSEEHTSELQSPYDLVCRLLLETKKKRRKAYTK